jgi:hypothetical protein
VYQTGVPLRQIKILEVQVDSDVLKHILRQVRASPFLPYHFYCQLETSFKVTTVPVHLNSPQGVGALRDDKSSNSNDWAVLVKVGVL